MEVSALSPWGDDDDYCYFCYSYYYSLLTDDLFHSAV